jgi:hypothetical protein
MPPAEHPGRRLMRAAEGGPRRPDRCPECDTLLSHRSSTPSGQTIALNDPQIGVAMWARSRLALSAAIADVSPEGADA